MKKATIFFLAYILFANVIAQNVGVGTTTPSQKLDVAGNINTTGNLMINGVAGTNGQVLGMNGGAMQWMDKSRFNNWALFTSSGTFNVPPGVTEILIEMWGAGGGGHTVGGGGGSGGYWTGLIPVTGIASISLTIGSGGSAGFSGTPGGDGGNTGFICTGFNVSTEGGQGADSSLANGNENYMAGEGGSGQIPGPTMPNGFGSFYFVNGRNGTPTTVNFVQTSSTNFSKVYTGGVGGVAPFSGQPEAVPLQFFNNFNGTNDISSRFVTGGYPFTSFGSGGSCRPIFNASPGSPGRIMIFY